MTITVARCGAATQSSTRGLRLYPRKSDTGAVLVANSVAERRGSVTHALIGARTDDRRGEVCGGEMATPDWCV